MCIQPEYACGCAGPKLEASVANKIAAGVPMAQAIAELAKPRSAKPRKALASKRAMRELRRALGRPGYRAGHVLRLRLRGPRLKPGAQRFLNPNGRSSGS